ncbi:MAG TPA: response regulator [Acidobacteria bacterium]|nr:response regulator [Acidobacteriota bacterium]
MKGRVLLVDDEPYILKILSFKLRREGLTTVEATCAEDALEALSSGAVDLILLDVTLATPTNGFELARRLKRDPVTAHIPIVMLTARHLADDVRRGREVGAAGYISKPFSTSELLEKIRPLLEARRRS